VLTSLLDQDVQIIIEDLVEESDLTLAEGRHILENILRPFAQLKQAQNGSVGNRLLQVGILETVAGLSQ
jgi:polyhydroxyalkanoate synthesis regulator phasin